MGSTVNKLMFGVEEDSEFKFKIQEAEEKVEAELKSEDDKATKETMLIPLDLIDLRNENDYSISDIDTLAESIKNNGLQQNIIVRKEGDRYILIAGERRTTAYKKLREDTHDSKYDNIMAEVYTNISSRKEDAIYKETNDTQRTSTMFEMVYRMKPCKNYFNKDKKKDVEKMAEYIQMKIDNHSKGYMFPCDPLAIAQTEARKADGALTEETAPDYVSVLINKEGKNVYIRWDNEATMIDYITLKLGQRYKDVKITSAGVKNYVSSILRCKYKPLITELIFKGKISPRELRDIVLNDEAKQRQIYQDIVEGRPWRKTKEQTQDEEVEDLSTMTNSEKIKSLRGTLNSFKKKVKDMNINIDELKGEERKQYKRIVKLLEMINEIENLAEK